MAIDALAPEMLRSTDEARKNDIEAKTEQAQPGRVAVGEEESDDDEDAIGEFTLWAAPRWHLLRELFMDEDLNHTALGGWSVGKFQVGGLARRCITSKDWARCVSLLGFTGNALAVFRAIAQECGSEEQEKQLRDAGVDFSDVITLSQLRRFEAQKSLETLIMTVRDEGSPSWQFAQVLKRRRRNLLRAWRLDLDLDDNGTVTFVEFSNQCRRLGFQGRVRQIWTSLRPLDDRALEFAELAPDESEHVEKFADLIWNVSGYDLDKAWGLFDYDKKNKLTKADFVQSAEHLGFTGNAEMIFQGLDREGLGWVWRADFEYIPKVSRNARLRLKETEGPLASLVSFARYQIGSCEELITMLGLGGGTSEVTVCDLAARLTALGFDGDAQHAAVLAARCDRGIGTKISAQKLLKVLTSNAKGTNVDQGGLTTGIMASPTVFIRKRSSAHPQQASKKTRPVPAKEKKPWNSTVADLCNSSKLHPSLRWTFNDFDQKHQKQKEANVQAIREAAPGPASCKSAWRRVHLTKAKTSSKFSPPTRRSSSSSSSTRSPSVLYAKRESWKSGFQAECIETTPKPFRTYFAEHKQHKPVRDEVQTILLSRKKASEMATTPTEGSVGQRSPAIERARSVG
ncbi:unnamed protein product [Durusdinium trenchii]|uniref:Calmodulin n=1 Tax=Durusdinium trenchii TaxID=1381693 RepID=A0ABP0R1L0_9DINO